MTVSPPRVVLVTFGTRGDIQPFCVLGRALQARGYRVRVVTTRDYVRRVRGWGLDAAEIGAAFEELLRDPRYDALFHGYFSSGLSAIPHLRALARRLREGITQLMLGTLAEIEGADLVIHNPFGFFAGEFARARGIPVIGVMCQPMLPSRRVPLSLFGGRDLGRLGNRLSYESLRLISPVLRRPLAEMRRRGVAGATFGTFGNPLTRGIGDSHQIMAFSPALSPDPGDWPVCPTLTGAWFEPPRPGDALPDAVRAFLSEGPAPVYVGFGSMLWGAGRNTAVVMRALAMWGGRAILATGTGGLQLPDAVPANVLAVGGLDHGLLFPHLAAVVHHGGAGTTAAALRAGRPNVVLPMLADQLYWGRRVAAVGAGEAPIQLAKVTAEDLAGRIARACDDPRYGAAAGAMAEKLAREPGVRAAADCVDRLMPARAGAV